MASTPTNINAIVALEKYQITPNSNPAGIAAIPLP
jgi:hypothetical protein